MDFVRHCSRCHVDYRPEILRCADCGGELEIRQEETDPDSEEDMPPEPPPGDYRSLYCTFEMEDLSPLTDTLTREGLPFRIDTSEQSGTTLVPRTRFDLKVRDEEWEKAKEILSNRPDFLDVKSASEAAEAGFDPERGYTLCPGCSARLSPGTTECPDCGLALGGGPESLLCSACGAEVSPADPSCPHCGALLES